MSDENAPKITLLTGETIAVSSMRGVMPDEAGPQSWAPTSAEKPRFSDGLDIPGTYRMDTNPNDRPMCSGPITVLTPEEADQLLGRINEDVG